MNIGLVTDRKGVPAMFEMYPGSVSDVSTLERTVDRVKDMGKGDCVIVMGRMFGSAGRGQHTVRTQSNRWDHRNCRHEASADMLIVHQETVISAPCDA